MIISDLKYNSKSSGFTLVETLIAIAILMIAIAGPLTIANQALTSALGSRNAMIATYLAQDGMESIKNIKDNNLSAGGNWLNNINTTCDLSSNDNSYKCATPSAFTLSSGAFISSQPSTCNNDNNCLLYTDDTNNIGYFYKSNLNDGRATQFTRYYYVKLLPVGAALNVTEAIITVVVSWTDGSVPNEIRLQELMTNSTR